MLEAGLRSRLQRNRTSAADCLIQCIDPDSCTVRSYYPDFIFQREKPDGSLKYVIVVVKAKKYIAQQIAVARAME